MESKFNDGLKVLGFTNLSKLEILMSRHFLLQLKAVSDEVTDVPKSMKELNDYVKQGKFTHVYVLDEHFHPLEGSLKGCEVPIVGLMGDHYVPWAVERKKKYIFDNDFDDVFVFTNRFLEPYKGLSRFHSILTGYDSEIFVDKKVERDIDILISGSVGSGESEWIYPVRRWLHDIIPLIGEKEGLKIEYLKHPGHFPEDDVDYQELYSDILNRSKIASGGSSHWSLSLKKLYEIPASGAILTTDIPVDDSDFFKERVLEVDINKFSSNNYIDKFRSNLVSVLENYDSYKRELQPFRSDEDRFNRSYEGRALEMRAIMRDIK